MTMCMENLSAVVALYFLRMIERLLILFESIFQTSFSNVLIQFRFC